MSKFKVFIDYDEDPKIGGTQGIFFLDDSGHTHDFSDLIGSKIVACELPKQELENAWGHSGRVLVLTLEKQ